MGGQARTHAHTHPHTKENMNKKHHSNEKIADFLKCFRIFSMNFGEQFSHSIILSKIVKKFQIRVKKKYIFLYLPKEILYYI